MLQTVMGMFWGPDKTHGAAVTAPLTPGAAIRMHHQCTVGTTVRLSAEAYAFAKSHLNDKHEVGGSLVCSPSGELVVGQTTAGEQRAVEIPIAAVNFHTHPNFCRGRVDCALGVPSAADMHEIAQATKLHGSMYHVVFAHEGTYVVRAPQPSRPLAGVRMKFAAIQSTYDPDTEPYASFIARWLALAAEMGYTVRYFKPAEPVAFSWGN